MSIIRKRLKNSARVLTTTDINAICYAAVTRIKPNQYEKITIDNIKDINQRRNRKRKLLNKNSATTDPNEKNLLQQRVTTLSVSELYALVSCAKFSKVFESEIDILSKEIAKSFVKKRVGFSQRISSFFLSFRNRNSTGRNVILTRRNRPNLNNLNNLEENNNDNNIDNNKYPGLIRWVPLKKRLSKNNLNLIIDTGNPTVGNNDIDDNDNFDQLDFNEDDSAFFDTVGKEPRMRIQSEKSPRNKRRSSIGIKMHSLFNIRESFENKNIDDSVSDHEVTSTDHHLTQKLSFYNRRIKPYQKYILRSKSHNQNNNLNESKMEENEIIQKNDIYNNNIYENNSNNSDQMIEDQIYETKHNDDESKTNMRNMNIVTKASSDFSL